MQRQIKDLPTRWAVYRLGHLGDVVLTTGVLTRLGEDFGWKFHCITAEQYAPVFSGHPFVEEISCITKTDLSSFSAFSQKAKELAAALQGYGLLDLHGTLRSKLLACRWHGHVLQYPKLGLERRFFLATNKRFYGQRLLEHTVPQRYYMAVSSPPPKAVELLPRLYLSDDEKALARKRLDELFSPGSHPVAMHPFATHSLKAWPQEHWRSLASQLDQLGIPWLILGQGDALFPECSNDLTARTTLRETCALLSECRVLVTGDSGPMHLAEAVGTPVAALFGPTTREWGFYPAAAHDIILECDMSCRPCSLHGKKPCPENGTCMSAITPHDVFNALQSRALLDG